MIKVLIADDHPAFRTGLKSVLADNNEGLLIDVEEAKNGQEVLNRLTARTYDLIFLDVAMPGRNGLEILEDIKKNRPKTNVLMMSMYSEEQYAVRAMKAGAAGYLTKDGEPDDIITAVKNVMAGRKHFSASVFEQLVFELENSGEKKMHEKLSAREYQVMRMIAAGKSTPLLESSKQRSRTSMVSASPK